MTDATQLWLIGIGASAGGLPTLEAFFSSLPTDVEATLIVMAPPGSPTIAPSVLPTYPLTEKTTLQPNTVYWLLPGQPLPFGDREPTLPAPTLAAEVDGFFHALAQAGGDRTLGIWIGEPQETPTPGLQALHQAGGIAFWQTHQSGAFTGLASHSIPPGWITEITSPTELAEVVASLLFLQQTAQPVAIAPSGLIDPDQLWQIVRILAQHENTDLFNYKPITLSRQIWHRCRLANHTDLSSYLANLESNPAEQRLLSRHLLNGTTRFFRDPAAWNFLADYSLPNLIERLPPDETLRLWVPGCATGEEAYSLAMMVDEVNAQAAHPVAIKIFATDLNPDALKIASAGTYPDSIAAHVSPARLAKYFTYQEGYFQVKRSLREMLIIGHHDLIKHVSLSKMHLVSCRNVLSAMQPALQQHILRTLHFSLTVKGVLFLGSFETLGALAGEFTPLNVKWKIFQKRRNVQLAPTARDRHQNPSPLLPPVLFPPQQPQLNPALLDQVFQLCFAGRNLSCFLINQDNQLLHIFHNSLSLLEGPIEATQVPLTSLIHPELRQPLTLALHRVRRDRHPLIYSGLRFPHRGSEQTVTLRVSPAPNASAIAHNLIVVFEAEATPITLAQSSQLEPNQAASQPFSNLEYELRTTYERLQSAIDDLESSNEEQKATNEELSVVNEELQSTNEELQAINEELYAVNSEYQQKIDEFTRLNTDLENLLRSTNIGVIFLDQHLNLRKFTTAATRAINIRTTDIDRPLSHFTHNLDCNNFLDLLYQVAKTNHPWHQEVTLNTTGECLLMQIHPYLKDQDQFDGLVITFIDIDSLKTIHRRLQKQTEELEYLCAIAQQSDARLRLVLEATKMVCWEHNLTSGQILAIGRYEGSQWQMDNWYLTPEASPIHPEDLPAVQAAVETAIASRSEFEIEHRVIFENHPPIWVLAKGTVLSNESGQATRIIGVTINIDRSKQTEAALHQSETAFRNMAANVPGAIFRYVLRKDGSDGVIFMSEGCYELWEVDAQAVLENATILWDMVHPEDKPSMYESVIESARTLQPWAWEWRIITPSGQQKWLQSAGRPERTPQGDTVWDTVIFDVSARKQAEVALHRSEALFRSLFEQAKVGIVLCNAEMYFLRVNQKYCDLTGYSEAELLSLRFVDLTEPADRPNNILAVQQMLAGERSSFSIEKRYIRKDGSTIWVTVTGSIIRDEEQAPTTILGIVENISDRRHSEEALRISEQRFRAIFEHSAVGIVIVTPPDYKLIITNPAFRKLLGYRADELIDLNYQDITVAEDLPLEMRFVEECTAGQRDYYHLEKRYIRKDGQIIWANLVTSVIRDADNEIQFGVSIVEDITSRKQAIELEISRNRDLKEAIFEEATDAIFLVDAHTRLTLDCNQRAVELFEAESKAELVNIEGNTLQKEEFSPEELALIQQEINERGFWSQELEYVTCKGKTFWGRLSTKQIQVADSVMNLVQVADISDRKQVELDMRRNMAELERLNQNKDDFLSTVSHELRTPLTNIDMATRMLKIVLEQKGILNAEEDPQVERLRQYLQILTDQSYQERELIEDLLDLQRLNAETFDVELEAIDLASWLPTLTDAFQTRAIDNQQNFQVHVAPRLPFLRSNPQALRRILAELLNNACKYTPSHETITLTITPLETEGTLTQLQFCIRNTGIEIPPEELPHIFEPFYRLARGDRWSKRGTGLGLTLSRQLVNRLGGTITATSSNGQVCFEVVLPCQQKVANQIGK